MSNPVTRHYAMVNGRRVHYRRCGEGPPLILLHASPVSSQAFLEDYLPCFSEHFCCIAPDTPGNGLSDPLPDSGEVTIDDYVDALAAFLDTIGVKECILYGRHTGALIAFRFAQKHPNRVMFTYCDGFPIFTQDEVKSFLPHYLPSFEPDVAGSFLPWLWFRYRDQHVFWSWFQQDSDHRAETDVPSLEFINRGVLDFLLSGNDYIDPYRAALEGAAIYKPNEAMGPMCFAIRPGDSLFGVQDRINDLPEGCWRQVLPRETNEAVLQELDILLRYHDASPGLPAPSVGKQDGDNPMFLPHSNGQLFVRRRSAQNPSRKPLVMVPHIPVGGGPLEAKQAALPPDRDILLIDPPGHGDSSLSGEHSIEHYADAVLEALTVNGCTDFDIYADRTGCVLASELALRLGAAHIERLEPFDLSISCYTGDVFERELDLKPSWEGAHLLRLWHHLRDEQLWSPWNDRRQNTALDRSWAYDVDAHHIAFVGAAKQMENYSKAWRAVSEYGLKPTVAVAV